MQTHRIEKPVKLPSNVVRLSQYRKKARPQAGAKQRSFYDIYPMKFFDKKTRNSWAVQPTGDHVADLETGKQFAADFLKSCDMTVGWGTLLPIIVADMVKAGPAFQWPNGRPKADGIIIGFMGVVTKAVMVALYQRGGFPHGGAA